MPTANELTEQQRARWSDAAQAWEKWDGWFEQNTSPLSEWLCTAAGVAPGKHMLDIACGSGHPSVLIASRVAPNGRVTATDVSPEMVAVTRRRAQRMGVHNLEAREMDAQALDFPDRSFDGATCRLGLMFCPEPVKAATHIKRVLRPGSRFALAVWDEPSKNAFFTSLNDILGRFVPMPQPDPLAPGPFRLAAPGELEQVLAAAGFSKITVESRPLRFGYQSTDEYWQSQCELNAPLKGATGSLAPDDLKRLKNAVLDAALPNVAKDGTVAFAAVPLCAVATA